MPIGMLIGMLFGAIFVSASHLMSFKKGQPMPVEVFIELTRYRLLFFVSLLGLIGTAMEVFL